ncbi:hypothetical protein P692DRAFT_20829516 [Suillus brevipes Sb2]|nr:hypothetical protein P692DRAFT_20829516 [Suillus brevipes Sb2]
MSNAKAGSNFRRTPASTRDLACISISTSGCPLSQREPFQLPRSPDVFTIDPRIQALSNA